jgi:3-hydroxyacyl-CoA dehydrogenase
MTTEESRYGATIKKVFIVGAGLMGGGIAQVVLSLASSHLTDVDPASSKKLFRPLHGLWASWLRKAV